MGAKETNFNWLWTDGSLFEFNNWAEGRPDSAHSPDSPDEACLKVYGSKYNSSYPLHSGYEYIRPPENKTWGCLIDWRHLVCNSSLKYRNFLKYKLFH